MTLVPVTSLAPNPFRNVDRYPYDEAKLAALRESIAATGLWPNLIGREANGHYELPYGHHRLRVLTEDYPGEQVDLRVQELTDDDMMQIMARENMVEWGTNAAVEMETIRAIVEAYAAGRIHLGELSEDTSRNHIRYAPSFVLGEGPVETSQQRPYTAQQVAVYIGWVMPNGRPRQKTHDILQALELIEQGILADADYRGLTTAQAQLVTDRARHVRDDQRKAARAYEEKAQRDAEEAERLRQQREKARQAREKAERELAEQRDAQARQAAAKAAQAARDRYEQAGRQTSLAEAQERQSARLVTQQKDYGRQQAGAAGRETGQQVREGASVREAAAAAAAAATVTTATAYEEGARKAIGVIRRFLSEGDLHILLIAIGKQPEAQIPDELRGELAKALEELSNSALQFRGMVLQVEMAGTTS